MEREKDIRKKKSISRGTEKKGVTTQQHATEEVLKGDHGVWKKCYENWLCSPYPSENLRKRKRREKRDSRQGRRWEQTIEHTLN